MSAVDHTLPQSVRLNDLKELIKVDRAAFVDVDPVEALLVALLVPNHLWKRLVHQLATERTALIYV